MSKEIIKRTVGEYEDFLKDFEETQNFCESHFEANSDYNSQKSHPEANSDYNSQKSHPEVNSDEAGPSSDDFEPRSLGSPKILRAHISDTPNEDSFNVKKITRKTRAQRKSLLK